MQKEFKKYTEGKVSKSEFEAVIQALTEKANSKDIDKNLAEYWNDCLSNPSLILPKKETLDKIHQQIGIKPAKVNVYKVFSLVAAVLLLAIIIGNVFMYNNLWRIDQNISQHMTTPYGARTTFELPDGSTVWLNSGSSISFPSNFVGNRMIELTGEAYFEVAKSISPFIVSTQYGDVEALGTAFNVKSFDKEDFHTTLVHGKVRISTSYSKDVILNPGYQFIREEGMNPQVRNVETELYTSWKDGKLIFKREPFKDVVMRLERWYNVEIKLNDPALETLKYTGTIEMESFSEMLELLKVTTPIVYSFNRDTRILNISMK